MTDFSKYTDEYWGKLLQVDPKKFVVDKNEYFKSTNKFPRVKGYVLNQNLNDLDLSNIEGVMLTISSSTMFNTDFSNSIFHGLVLKGCRSNGANFTGVNMVNSVITETIMNEVNFTRGQLFKGHCPRISWKNSIFDSADFSASDMSFCFFEGVTGNNTYFLHTDLTNAYFTKASLPNAQFRLSVMVNTICANLHAPFSNFRNAILRNTNFVDAVLEESKFTGSQMDHTDFTRANLHRSDLRECDLLKAIFDDADTVGALFDPIRSEEETAEFEQLRLDAMDKLELMKQGKITPEDMLKTFSFEGDLPIEATQIPKVEPNEE